MRSRPHPTAAQVDEVGQRLPADLTTLLRQLTATGWLRPTSRGAYAVPAERVVPLHVVLAVASG